MCVLGGGGGEGGGKAATLSQVWKMIFTTSSRSIDFVCKAIHTLNTLLTISSVLTEPHSICETTSTIEALSSMFM